MEITTRFCAIFPSQNLTNFYKADGKVRNLKWVIILRKLIESKYFDFSNLFRLILIHRFLRQFYFENSSTELIAFKLKSSDILIPFIPVLKCANKGIKENLMLVSSPLEPKDYFSTQEEWLNFSSNKDGGRSGGKANEIKAFTFVRDPLQHFYSGFAHSAFVTFYPPSLFPLFNESAAETVLQDLILQRPLQMQMAEYMFPMAASYLRFPADIVGRLESFAEDWQQQILPAYHLPFPYDFRLGDHPTSVNHPQQQDRGTGGDRDPLGVRKSLAALFASKPRYLRALCHLLLIDYICLPGYDLPSECAFLTQMVERTRRALAAGVRLV